MSLEDLARYIDKIAPDASTTPPGYVADPTSPRRGFLVGAATVLVMAIVAVSLVLFASRGEESAPVLAGPGQSQTDPSGGTPGTTTQVLCPVYSAKVQIAQGTTAEDAIDGSMISEAQIPVQFVPATAVRDLSEVLGGRAVFDIAADSVLVQGMFEPAPDLQTVATIPGECRATSAPPTTAYDPTFDQFGWEVPADDADAVVATALTDDPAAAQALGDRLIAETTSGECKRASAMGLGSLTGLADWLSACPASVGQPEGAGVSITSVQGVPNLWFGPGNRPPMPSICFRHIVGHWWSFYSGHGLAEPCSASFEYQGL